MYKKLKIALIKQHGELELFNNDIIKDIKKYKHKNKKNFEYEKEIENLTDEEGINIKVNISCKNDAIIIEYKIIKEIVLEDIYELK